MVSGDKVGTRALHAGLGLKLKEQLLGIIAIGTASKLPIPGSRPKAEVVLSVWPDEISTGQYERAHRASF